MDVEASRPRRPVALAGRGLLVIAGVALWGWGAIGIVGSGVTVTNAAACVAGVIAALVGLAGPRATVDAMFDVLGSAS